MNIIAWIILICIGFSTLVVFPKMFTGKTTSDRVGSFITVIVQTLIIIQEVFILFIK